MITRFELDHAAHPVFLDLEPRCSRQKQHPFMLILLIPEIFRRMLSSRYNALNPHRAAAEKFVELFPG